MSAGYMRKLSCPQENVKANTDAELYDYDYTNSAQSQKAVTTYFSSKQLLPLALKRI